MSLYDRHFAPSSAQAEIDRIAANFKACAESVMFREANPKEFARVVQRAEAAADRDRLLGPLGPTKEDPLFQNRLPIHDQRRKALLLCN